jgi:hypothetical protein
MLLIDFLHLSLASSLLDPRVIFHAPWVLHELKEVLHETDISGRVAELLARACYQHVAGIPTPVVHGLPPAKRR